MNIIPFFILIAGFIIGLGAVTIIDLHGFLGRRSHYWTEATTRTHKVTKPLIWIGMILFMVGAYFFYRDVAMTGILLFHVCSVPVMIANGVFLSFVVSPFLLKREAEGKSTELLPQSLQNKIIVSFLISFISWWGNVLVFSWYVVNHLIK